MVFITNLAHLGVKFSAEVKRRSKVANAIPNDGSSLPGALSPGRKKGPQRIPKDAKASPKRPEGILQQDGTRNTKGRRSGEVGEGELYQQTPDRLQGCWYS